MIEYQYDEKTFRKMALRANAVVYGVLAAIFGVLVCIWVGYAVSDYLQGEHSLTSMLMTMLFIAIVLVVVIVVFVLSIRKQLSKSFAMYSVNGIVHERVEITAEELVATNVLNQNVARLKRSEIAAVKKYKDCFTIVTKTKLKWVVPLTEQTVVLYNELTGSTDLTKTSTEAAEAEKNETVVLETEKEQVVQTKQTDALSFEYEITEKDAISMLTKVIGVRFRIVLAAAIIFSALAVGYGGTMIGLYAFGSEFESSHIYLAVLALVLSVFFWVCYGLQGKSGEKSGKSYFASGAKDGVFLQRIELYEQGIVVINELRDMRTKFRIADMDKIRLLDDFFYVEFKSKAFLPIPLTDSTRKLYDILHEGIK